MAGGDATTVARPATGTGPLTQPQQDVVRVDVQNQSRKEDRKSGQESGIAQPVEAVLTDMRDEPGIDMPARIDHDADDVAIYVYISMCIFPFTNNEGALR